MRSDLRRNLDRAAALESARRPNAISAGALANEILDPAVAKILETADQQPDRRHTPDRRAVQ